MTRHQDNTTLFASDRDMFVFLADEDNRIENPNRRAGRFGSFARGFFVWNSEVGKTTLGAGFFLFDYVCCNRIVWGETNTPRSASATPTVPRTGGSKRSHLSSTNTARRVPSRWSRRGLVRTCFGKVESSPMSGEELEDAAATVYERI